MEIRKEAPHCGTTGLYIRTLCFPVSVYFPNGEKVEGTVDVIVGVPADKRGQAQNTGSFDGLLEVMPLGEYLCQWISPQLLISLEVHGLADEFVEKLFAGCDPQELWSM